MWMIISLFVVIFCTDYMQADYNTGAKARVYEHPQPYPSADVHYSQYGDGNKDKDYRTSLPHHYVQTDNSHQKQQHEDEYYHQTLTAAEQHYPQGPHVEPIYERKGNSQMQTKENWQNSEHLVNEYYTGCPTGHTGQLPYAYDCRRFLNCWHGKGHIQACSVGTVFNPETLECDSPKKVRCEAALAVLGAQSVRRSPPSSDYRSFQQPNYRAGRYIDVTNDNLEVLCSAEVGGLQPHPSDCTRFINCAHGKMHIQQCGPGTAYSISMKVCDFVDKVDCSGRQGGDEVATSKQETQATPTSFSPSSNTQPHATDILCLDGMTGLFPYPFDYTKFIHCQNGKTAIQNCVANTAFSISKGYCESLDDILKSDHVVYIVSQVSYEYSQTLVSCPPGTEGVHLYPFNAELFVNCLKSQMSVVACNNDRVFSITRRTCMPLAQVLKNERVRLLSEVELGSSYRVTDERYSMNNMVYCPSGATGVYPHPFDSVKYLKCVRGRLMSETCASGQAFSLSRKACNLKEEIKSNDYVPQAKSNYDQEWRVSDIETIHGSIDGFTYLMCPPGLNGYFLHPFDTTKYIECAQGTIVIDNCLNGAIYSISRSECIPKDNVGASDHVAYTALKNDFTNESSNQYYGDLGVSCNLGTFGIYPHPYYFNKYIRCANGRISVEVCSAGQVFSLSRSSCHKEAVVDNKDRISFNGAGFSVTQSHYKAARAEPISNTGLNNPDDVLQLSLRPPPATAISPPSGVLRPPLPSSTITVATDNVECPPGASGRYPHPYDCAKFLMCTNGEVHVQNCAPGTAWNKKMEVCDFAERVSCSQSSAASSMTSSTQNSKYQYRCPAGVEGVHQHPYDWHKYLVCNHGHSTVMDCAPGTVFSLSRKTCYLDANVPNTDRCNNGVYSSDYEYPYKQNYNSKESTTYDHSGINIEQSFTGTTQSQPTAKIAENRWTNMNVPRPQSPAQATTFNSLPTRPGLTPVLPGTTLNVNQYNPADTVSHEAKRNNNHHLYSTPLAPLKSVTSNTTPTIVYAQPVGSQEDSKEIFSNTPEKSTNFYNSPYHPSFHRKNHTSHLAVHTDTHVQMPINLNLDPPYHIPQPPSQYPYNLPAGTPRDQRLLNHYEKEDSVESPLSASGSKITSINNDQLPGQISYNLDDFDQQPSGTSKKTILSDSKINTTAKMFPVHYEQVTQTPLLPQITSTTIRTFSYSPHYSSPYSEVSHSRNASWVGRKTPQESGLKSTYQSNVPSPQYYGLSPQPHSNNERNEGNHTLDDQEATMKAALKLLLRPYLDSQSKTNADVAEKAQTHIMNLVSNPEKDTITSTITRQRVLNNHSIVSATTPQQDVEFILAGEQNNLLGITAPPAIKHETSTSHDLYPTHTHHDRNNNWHKHQFHDSHHFKLHHSREFHNKHPNLPNPFDDSKSSDSEHTKQETYDFDVGTGAKCHFDCGNGVCVEQHEICDGVNNCGNRKEEQDCGHLGYELRLTGGQSSNMGRVEVKILGKWGYVCDDKFGLHDADVVCRELGFKMGAMEVRGNSYYLPSDANVYFAMDEVQCEGNETSLKECDFTGWGVSNCGPDEVVGVVCKVPKLKCPDNYWLCSTSKECIPTAFLCDLTPDCDDGSDESVEVCNAPIKYRLEGGRSSNEGRLEVFYHGEWGTVCDDDFTLKEAQVFCNSIGLYGKPEIVKNIYGPGSGPIWLDQVSCLGQETNIDECNHWSWGENNCNHTEDVGLKCTAGPKPNLSKGNKSLADDFRNQDKYLESTLQIEQNELDALGLYQGLWQRSSKAAHTQKKCGQFKSNLFDEYEHPEERVVNGTIAKRGRHPWQATIRTRGRGGISSHWCGAVIISRKLILTAAHCLAGYPKGSYFVRMGDHRVNIAESSEIDSNIENWYIHDRFRDQKHMNNDIALVLLKTPVRFNDYVQPICLPEKGATLEANRMCTISGWGSIKSGTSTSSNVLRSAQVPILPDEVCSQKNVYANAMTEGMFCAGYLDESADACDGDSGGPLVCSDEDGETLYGIISWGQHCGYANHPGVYVRVEKYIDWIYDRINLMMQQGKL